MAISPVQFTNIAHVIMAMPSKPTDADVLLALVRAERLGYEKGLSMGRLEQRISNVNSGARFLHPLVQLIPDGT
jgi:hypothetical protein